MATQVTADRDVSESGARLILITLGIMAATLMQTLDSTIVNVALPTIQGNLGATQDEGAWVVTGYIISAVIVIPLTPWLQARFGRKQYYSVAIIGFTIASMLCGIASSIDQLIVYRIIQGLFGGGLIATGQASLRDTFPRHLLGASQAVFALGAIVGPSVGPTVGGWLTDNFSWNWVFFINLVPGIFASIVILTMMRNPTDPKPIPVDAIGLGLLAVGLGSLQYILDEGQRNDWFDDPLIRLLAFTTVAGLAAFIVWELWGTKRPIVDLRAYKYRAIAAGSALGFAIGAVLFGATVILPQYVQGILGFTATLSGELIFVRAAFIALLTPFIARIAGAGKIDTRILLVTGFTFVGVSQIWLGYITTSQNDFASLLGPTIMAGVALSLLFVPIQIAVLSGIPPAQVPKAAAFQSLSLQLGGSFSTAALITLLARRNAFHQSVLAQAATPDNPALQTLIGQLHSTSAALMDVYGQIVTQASVMAYADCQWALGALTFVLLPLVFVLPRRRKGGAAVPIAAE
ncbi:MAG TPA: DHA2 family efflux MFS transporter permease subunit [Candidatus Elarobacter sp.]|jgi:DHA2 family multidrug resistance protein|nr:DHA2 family efflux MFS transporter permease subunit [Candidatus Elarobacter sp.]